jgi:DNA-binding Lrp family transcriptional regulator
MDEVDRHLISLLRNDARMPVASIAKALRVSRGTVQNRMARLEARCRGAPHPGIDDGCRRR